MKTDEWWLGSETIFLGKRFSVICHKSIPMKIDLNQQNFQRRINT